MFSVVSHALHPKGQGPRNGPSIPNILGANARTRYEKRVGKKLLHSDQIRGAKKILQGRPRPCPGQTFFVT